MFYIGDIFSNKLDIFFVFINLEFNKKKIKRKNNDDIFDDYCDDLFIECFVFFVKIV